MNATPSPADWSQFAGPTPPGSALAPTTAAPVLAPPSASTKPPPKKRTAQVPGGGKAPSSSPKQAVADEALKALLKMDEDNARDELAPVPRAGAPRSLAEIRAHVTASYDDGAPEITLMLDMLDAWQVHMDTLVEEFDGTFSSILDQAEPLSRRLDLTKAALASAEKSLGLVTTQLAEATGNQQRIVDALNSAAAAMDRHNTTLSAAIAAARQGGPFAKAAAQLVPVFTFIAGAGTLYFFLLWMR